MAWMKWLGILLVTLTVLAVGLMAYGSWRWNESTQALLARLEAAREPHAVVRYDARELDGLPAPVQRYFQAALTDGQAIIAAVSIQHAGTFNMSATAEQWKPFTSQQRVITQRPGFDWDARVMMFPGVPVHVHDAYVAGEGILRGELLRFFAEACWYPSALLPSQGVRWQAVDDTSALATLTDGKLAVTLLFRFNADGLIATVYAEARDRVADGKTASAPWQGRFWNYAVRDGMRVPLNAEVAWLLPEGTKTYFRATTTALSYEFAK